MAIHAMLLLEILLLPLYIFFSVPPIAIARSINNANNNSNMQTYIVHLQQSADTIIATSLHRKTWHESILQSTFAAASEQRMVYSYNHVISGFTARLTETEVEALRSHSHVLQVYSDKFMMLHTTRSPTFLGLNQPQGAWNRTNFGKGVIIGVVDTGVTPGHPSFSGDGLPPPPKKWKGKCEFNTSICNNKLIGARVFLEGAAALNGGRASTIRPFPIDEDGHGTHVASTAAGWFVHDANALRQGWGTAAGVAPLAHIAMYRACDLNNCAMSDILAGMDAAIEDGVDVISLSVGLPGSSPFDQDMAAVGAFTAVEKGVFVSCSAGNGGPDRGTLSNEAPWMLTVAASTMDRRFGVTLKLGNGLDIEGQCVYQPNASVSESYPMVLAGASGKSGAAFCGQGSLDGFDVKGKIVLCEQGGFVRSLVKGMTVKSAGGAGMILLNSAFSGDSVEADTHVLLAAQVSFSEATKIRAYINSTRAPTVAFTSKGTTLGASPAPTIASFSSRGPSVMSPGILKPDITAPGVSILAAWPGPVGPPSVIPTENYFFNVISGTSMSTPHLSGIAALIKSAHPDWSPPMIKSAMMTTADVQDRAGNPILDEQGKPASFPVMGAGHVNVAKALDPGLVFDIHATDYLRYLCGLGYTNLQVGVIASRPIDCNLTGFISATELNYPAIMAVLSGSEAMVSVTRTVKNVGEAKAVYAVEVDAPGGVSVSVEPKDMEFDAVNEEKNFTVIFTGGSRQGFGEVEGQLRWISGARIVRSPIIVSFR